MGRGISKMAKKELLATIRERYQESGKRDKGRILDEFTAVTGLHRKHAIRLLAGSHDGREERTSLEGRRVYDEAVREAVIVVWEASDRICGKRLKAALPSLVESMERHGHLELDSLGETTAAHCQRIHPGPAAQARPGHCWQPAPPAAKKVHEPPGAGTDLQRLE